MHFTSVRIIFLGIWMAAYVLLAFSVQDFSTSNDHTRKAVNQVRKALGGSSMLDSIQSLSARGTISGTSLAKFPVDFKLDMLFPDKLMRILKWRSSSGTVVNIEVINNEKAWTNSNIKIGKKLSDVVSFSASVNPISGMGRGAPGGMGGDTPGGMGGGAPGGMGGDTPGGMGGGAPGGMGGGAPGGMGGGAPGGMGGGAPGGMGRGGLDGNLVMLLSKMIEGMMRGGMDGGAGKTDNGLPPGGVRGSDNNKKAINGISPNILEDRNSQKIAYDFFCLLIALMPNVRDSIRIETVKDTHFNITTDANVDFLNFSSASGPAITLAINQKTHLPIAASYCLDGTDGSRNPNSTIVQIYFSEYRKVSGKKGVHMLLPHQIAKTQNGKTVERMEINKYQLNNHLKPEQFEKK
jgi:hypothetical protein